MDGESAGERYGADYFPLDLIVMGRDKIVEIRKRWSVS